MLESVVQFVIAAIVPCAILVGLLWLLKRVVERWADRRQEAIMQRRAERAPDRQVVRRKIDAELVEDAPRSMVPAPSAAMLPETSIEQRQCCRSCGTIDAVSWHRASTIEAVGGFVGWSRRLRGLPELYSRARPPFGIENLCAECSHIRDRRVDTRIHIANLAILRVGEENALENQRFLATLDHEMRSVVVPKNRLAAANADRTG